MGDDQDGAGIIAQMAFEPVHRLGVEMVGGFVEEQEVGLVEQELAQGDAAALAAGEVGDLGVVGRAAERIHGLVDLGVEVPQPLGLDLVLELRHLVGGLLRVVDGEVVVAVEHGLLGGDALHDVLAHRLVGVELRLLRQVADPGAFGDPAITDEVGVDAGHDAQQGGLARAVDAQDADLGVRVEGQVDGIEHLAVARIGLGQTPHVIDELPAVHGFLGPRAAQGRWGPRRTPDVMSGKSPLM